MPPLPVCRDHDRPPCASSHQTSNNIRKRIIVCSLHQIPENVRRRTVVCSLHQISQTSENLPKCVVYTKYQRTKAPAGFSTKFSPCTFCPVFPAWPEIEKKDPKDTWTTRK